MTTILIEIEGGNVQRIVSNEDCRVILIDKDNIEAGDPIDVTPNELDWILVEGDKFSDLYSNDTLLNSKIKNELKQANL